MDDPQTGRFWQIDPLADKYVYNSTYAFSENKVTGHVELEDLEAVPYTDPKQATYAWGEQVADGFASGLDKLSSRVEGGITYFSNLFSTGSNSVSVEHTVSASAEATFSSTNFLGYVKANNSSSVAPSMVNIKFVFEIAKPALVVTGKVGIVSGQISTEKDKNGVTTNKSTASIDTKIGVLPVTLFGFTSNASDRQKEAGGGVAVDANKAKWTFQSSVTRTTEGTRKANTQTGVEVKIGEQKGIKIFANASVSYSF